MFVGKALSGQVASRQNRECRLHKRAMMGLQVEAPSLVDKSSRHVEPVVARLWRRDGTGFPQRGSPYTLTGLKTVISAAIAGLVSHPTDSPADHLLLRTIVVPKCRAPARFGCLKVRA